MFKAGLQLFHKTVIFIFISCEYSLSWVEKVKEGKRKDPSKMEMKETEIGNSGCQLSFYFETFFDF